MEAWKQNGKIGDRYGVTGSPSAAFSPDEEPHVLIRGYYGNINIVN